MNRSQGKDSTDPFTLDKVRTVRGKAILKVCCVHAVVIRICDVHIYREFRVHVKTHVGLFHPDHHVVVVEGGREKVKYVDTRHFVVGWLEGKMLLLPIQILIYC